MRKLAEADVIRIMREEWSAKVKTLAEEVDVVMNSKVKDGSTVGVLSPGLKIKHKASGILYTVMSVGPRDVLIKPPDEDPDGSVMDTGVLVDAATLEREYKLD